MKIDFFTEKDFEHPYKTTDNILVAYTAARVANIKLNKKLVKIFGHFDKQTQAYNWLYDQYPDATKQAFLLEIIDIKKNCFHNIGFETTKINNDGSEHFIIHCRDCFQKFRIAQALE